MLRIDFLHEEKESIDLLDSRLCGRSTFIWPKPIRDLNGGLLGSEILALKGWTIR